MPERDELDRLIDSELARYAEPHAGLEQRMMARVSVEVARSSRRRWILVSTAPVFACIVLFTYVLLTSPHSRPGQVAFIPAVPSAAHVADPVEPQPTSRSLRGARVRQRAPKQIESKAIQHPKLDSFPTPRSLNPEEQALTRFATEAPEKDRKALVEAQQQIAEPLRISAIHIPPLAPEQDKY